MTARRIIPLILALITLAVYEHVRTQAFVRYDDDMHVYKNEFGLALTADNLRHFWQEQYHNLYIPLAYTAYMLIASVARLPSPQPQAMDDATDLNAHVFHVVNLVVHVLNVLLVYAIVRLLVEKIRGKPAAWPAAAGALFFALHPMQVESVAWVSELRGLLGALFSLIAIWLGLLGARIPADEPRRRAKPWAFFAGAAFAMVLSLLCKPSATSLPLITLALDRWVMGRSWKRCLAAAAPLFAISIAFAVSTRIVQPADPNMNYPLWQRPFIVGDSLAFYLGKMIWPGTLGANYGRSPEFVMRHWWGYATWLIPVALGLLIWRRRKKSPWLLAASAIFVGALLPVLGFFAFTFQHVSTVTDRYIYLALLAPALIVGCLLARWTTPAAGAAFGVVLVVFAWMTNAQIRTWDDTHALARQTFEVYPYHPDFYFASGEKLADEGKTAEARKIFVEILRYNPRFPDAHMGLAKLAFDTGDLDAAIPEIRAFLELVPDAEEAHFKLASAYIRKGDIRRALPEFESAVRLRPDMPVYHAAFGAALASAGMKEKAIAELKEAVRLQPDYVQAQQALVRLQGK